MISVILMYENKPAKRVLIDDSSFKDETWEEDIDKAIKEKYGDDFEEYEIESPHIADCGEEKEE